MLLACDAVSDTASLTSRRAWPSPACATCQSRPNAIPYDRARRDFPALPEATCLAAAAQVFSCRLSTRYPSLAATGRLSDSGRAMPTSHAFTRRSPFKTDQSSRARPILRAPTSHHDPPCSTSHAWPFLADIPTRAYARLRDMPDLVSPHASPRRRPKPPRCMPCRVLPRRLPVPTRAHTLLWTTSRTAPGRITAAANATTHYNPAPSKPARDPADKSSLLQPALTRRTSRAVPHPLRPRDYPSRTNPSQARPRPSVTSQPIPGPPGPTPGAT